MTLKDVMTQYCGQKVPLHDSVHWTGARVYLDKRVRAARRYIARTLVGLSLVAIVAVPWLGLALLVIGEAAWLRWSRYLTTPMRDLEPDEHDRARTLANNLRNAGETMVLMWGAASGIIAWIAISGRPGWWRVVLWASAVYFLFKLCDFLSCSPVRVHDGFLEREVYPGWEDRLRWLRPHPDDDSPFLNKGWYADIDYSAIQTSGELTLSYTGDKCGVIMLRAQVLGLSAELNCEDKTVYVDVPEGSSPHDLARAWAAFDAAPTLRQVLDLTDIDRLYQTLPDDAAYRLLNCSVIGCDVDQALNMLDEASQRLSMSNAVTDVESQVLRNTEESVHLLDAVIASGMRLRANDLIHVSPELVDWLPGGVEHRRAERELQERQLQQMVDEVVNSRQLPNGRLWER